MSPPAVEPGVPRMGGGRHPTDPAVPFDPTRSRVGVYVHFPYCARHCPYCDFTVTVTRAIPHEAYRDAVLAELRKRAISLAGRPPAVSLYFGGGTPGLWAPDCVAAVIDGVERTLGLASEAEITVECNPEEVSRATLLGLRAAGVRRVSLGAQSLDDDRLRRLGRQHRGDDVRRAVEWASGVGLSDLSIDLMYGLAGQTAEEAAADVAAAAALGPTHLSTYQLTVEPRTAFGARARRGEVVQAPEDVLVDSGERVREALRGAGYAPYEVSNAARPGREAVHNTLYWTLGEYLGLGAGAHGFVRFGGAAARGADGVVARRWENQRHAGRYIRAALDGASTATVETSLDPATLLEDHVLTGLRLDRGLAVYPALLDRFGAAAVRLAEDGLLEVGPRWRVTPRGRALLDTVVSRLWSGGDGS